MRCEWRADRGVREMTWKRELAFWTFMFFVAIWLMYGVVSAGKFVSDNWGAGVEIARAK